LPHPLQNLPPRFLGKIQVQQKQMRTMQTHVPVHSLDKIHSLFPVIKNLELEIQTGLLQCLTNQKYVWFSIFD